MKILNFFHLSVKSEMEEETFTDYILDLFIAPAKDDREEEVGVPFNNLSFA